VFYYACYMCKSRHVCNMHGYACMLFVVVTVKALLTLAL